MPDLHGELRLPPPTAWFAGDAERHLLDRPRHCPDCGGSLVDGPSFVVEYWTGDDRVYYCWCGRCTWSGTIVTVHRIVSHESDH